MKRTLIVGNWKMHLSPHEASLLVKRLNDHIQIHRGVEVVLAPSLLTLQPISLEVDRRKFKLAAQNAYYKDEGAYTGEVSFTMLRGVADYALVGHSERRIYFNDTLEIVPDEIEAAIKWIRKILGELYGQQVSKDTRVIYGASVDAEFVGSILGLEGVDGLLPGAASLNYKKFAAIVDAAYRMQHTEAKS
jgi:triosephosphate isomerase